MRRDFLSPAARDITNGNRVKSLR